MSDFVGLLDNAVLLGRLRHIELQLFVQLGARAPAVETPRLAVWLSAAARAHAWRARLIEEVLPVSVGLPGAAALTAWDDPAIAEALGLLASSDDDALHAALLRAVYPFLVGAYDDFLTVARPVGDAPAMLAVRRAVADLERCRTGCDIPSAASPTTEQVADALARVRPLAGGPVGPDRL